MRNKSFILLFLFLILGCSEDNEEQIPEGNLEVLVITSDNLPIQGVSVNLLEKDLTIVTNTNGIALFENLAIGTYDISISVNDISYENTDPIIIENNKTTVVQLVTIDEADPIEPILLNLENLIEIVYGKLKNEYLFDSKGYVSYWGDIGSDIAYVNSMLNSRLYEIDTYQATSSNFIINKVWEEHYKLIRDIHIGLDAIEKNEFQPDDNLDLDLIEAEFRFVRALLYFNLVKLYGNPVLVTALVDPSGPPPNDQNANSTYDLIESDLLFAIDHLQSSTPRDKASVSAARALLGKVYLTMAGFPIFKSDGYVKALEQLKQVEGKYALEPNYADVFSVENEDNNSEVIFKIGFDGDGNYGVFWGPQGISFRDELFLATNFIENYFENPADISDPITFPLPAEDQRFFQNIATFTFQNGVSNDNSDIGEWRPYKYKKDALSALNLNEESFDLPYLRYADVLLMIAEAENAVNGPTQYAYEAINQVRRRAFGNADNDIETGLNQQDFLEAILNERRLELAFEGSRKDDLIRTQRLQATIDFINQDFTPNFIKDFQDFEYIWPIPQGELSLNQGVVQNPGY
ncbi:RagB/SusD family nutrient uptake outer membrane protein [Croceitalea rosinachiae]|uniref:RagB/SusD family nutrient uptake outer membrane protein n=1 Tax=Croceitalea rosinachiae TaxID=3075596 RepID=A0ABU3A927_9FLAO|nr:RagB/SusD family nutrient uptake outer membrane protein [Croceitalea sp. F388]MDT0606685.1 RagB/SusD family nutrient uptake outer membrane protein [Croceitalea sp. F388]